MLNASKVVESDDPAPYLAAGSIQPEQLILDETKMMSFSKDELVHYELRRHDIVVVEGGAGYGRSHLLKDDLPGWGFQNHVARLRSRGAVAPGFLLYCLRACLASGYIEANNRTATLPSLSRDVLRSIPVPLPPPQEQCAIADYLDRETARIDTLIEEQQRLIEMLHLRRRAVVDASLSQGLDAEVELSETGSQWLPKLPTGWKAVRAKRVLSFGPANGVSPTAGDTDDLKSLSLGAIRDGRVRMGPDVTKFVDGSGITSREAFRLPSW
ncbi:restriction endonuclease subunit S [Prescottella equi]